jgi:diaminopropionate ammonia-lyase
VPARVQAIESEGGRVVVIDGDYDAAVRSAEAAARDNDWLLVQDTAWDGYEQVPAWIMAGYVTILREMEATLFPDDRPNVDVVLLQTGVGSWAAAAAWYLCNRYGPRRPRIICVEPTEADCLLESAAAGRRARSRGTGRTIMAGLNCGTPSTLAWEILRQSVDAFLAIPDDYARDAMRLFHRPVGGDAQIISGESGSAGLAGLLAILGQPGQPPELTGLRSHLSAALGCPWARSRVLVFNTEGATDPESFRRIVGGWEENHDPAQP